MLVEIALIYSGNHHNRAGIGAHSRADEYNFFLRNCYCIGLIAYTLIGISLNSIKLDRSLLNALLSLLVDVMMKRIVLWLLIVIVIIFGVSFSVLNAEFVTLDYYYSDIEIPLSIIIVSALVLGIMIGISASLLGILRVRRELFRLRKKLKHKELEVSNMRAIPVQDLH